MADYVRSNRCAARTYIAYAQKWEKLRDRSTFRSKECPTRNALWRIIHTYSAYHLTTQSCPACHHNQSGIQFDYYLHFAGFSVGWILPLKKKQQQFFIVFCFSFIFCCLFSSSFIRSNAWNFMHTQLGSDPFSLPLSHYLCRSTFRYKEKNETKQEREEIMHESIRTITFNFLYIVVSFSLARLNQQSMKKEGTENHSEKVYFPASIGALFACE